jgi:hypothetical protein
LELGKTLVRELDLDGGRDTLARWMAHHLAELITQAEESKSSAARKAAAKRATDTILKIWDHRSNLPECADPMGQYRQILKVLTGLVSRPADIPRLQWQGRHRSIDRLYHRLSRLIRVLLLLDLQRSEKSRASASRLIRKFLTTEENRLLALFEVRLRVSDSGSEPQQSEQVPAEHERFRKLARKLIDETLAALEELRKELSGEVS